MPTIEEELLALKQQYRRENNLDLLTAVLGDASGVVPDPTRPDSYVLVRVQTSNGLSPARSVMVPSGKYLKMRAGTPVQLEYDKRGNLRIAEPDTPLLLTAGQNPLASTKPDPQRTPEAEALRCIPTNPPSMSVVLKSWMPIINDVAYQFGGMLVDLTGSQPASGQMRLSVIFVKNDYVSIEITVSTARAVSDAPLGLADVQECLNAKTAGSTPATAIKLTGDMTAIHIEDINQDGFDLRQIVNTSDGTASGDVVGPASATDNAIPRFDGTTGKLIQNGIPTIDDTGNINLNDQALLKALYTDYKSAAAPANPSAGYGRVYLDTADGHLKQRDNTGNVIDLAAASGATTALDNLASVAINTSLISDTDITDDLGSAAKRWRTGYIQTLASDSSVLRVKNTSGATANATECGYIDAAGEYKTTTTANYDGAWCVVLVGGANNADIYVARRGRVVIKLTGNCSAGNYLATSTTGGSAAVLTTMRPEVFAVALTANAGGAGGTCEALLYTGTRPVAITAANKLYAASSHSTTVWTGAINGVVSATSLTVTTSTGNINVLKPQAASQLGLLRLWNTTRNTYRLITAVNTGTGAVTTVSSADAWANTDTVTFESQTCTSPYAYKAGEIDLSQQSIIPALARAIEIEVTIADTGAVNQWDWVHPYESYADSKGFYQYNQITTGYNVLIGPISLIARTYCWLGQASGSGTASSSHLLVGYREAIP